MFTVFRILVSLYLLAFAVGCVMQVVASLRTGQIDTRHGVFRRRVSPIAYWLWTANSLFWGCLFGCFLVWAWRDLL